MARKGFLLIVPLVIGVLVGAAVLMAASSRSAGSTPEEWTIPGPRSGDEGVFTYAILSPSQSAREGLVPAVPYQEFVVNGTRAVTDVDGRAHARLEWIVREGGYASDESSDYHWGLETPRSFFRSSDGGLAAVSLEHPIDLGTLTPHTLPAASLSNIPDGRHTGNRIDHKESITGYDYATGAPDCLTSLRPGAHDTDRLRPFYECELRAPNLAVTVGDPVQELPDPASEVVATITSEDEFKVSGLTEIEGNSALLISRGPVQVWLSQDEPVPTQVAIDDGRVKHLWRLTHFKEGAAPVPRPEGPAVPEPVPMREPGFLGMTASDVDHPYPAATAWADAEATESVSSFLRDHPGTRVASLHGSVDAFDEQWTRATWSWEFVLWSPDQALRVQVSAPWIDGVGTVRAMGQVETREVDPVQLPESLPSVDALLGFLPPSDGWVLWGFSACDCNKAWIASIEPRGEAGADGRLHTYVQESGILAEDGVIGARWDAVHEATSGLATWAGNRPGDPEPADSTKIRWTDPRTAPWPEATLWAVVAAGASFLFLKAPWTALFSRIHGSVVLDHPTRQKIKQIVDEEPGIHMTAAARRAKISHRTLLHHVEKLEQAGFVMRRKAGGYTCLVPRHAEKADVETMVALRTKAAQALFASLKGKPGQSLSGLAEAIGVAPSTAHYHVRRLVEAGLVRVVREGRVRRHFATLR